VFLQNLAQGDAVFRSVLIRQSISEMRPRPWQKEDKLQFYEEHTRELESEVKKKRTIIQSFAAQHAASKGKPKGRYHSVVCGLKLATQCVRH
jgi:hypothetical protein